MPFKVASFKDAANGVYGKTVTINNANNDVTNNEKAGFDWINGNLGERSI